MSSVRLHALEEWLQRMGNVRKQFDFSREGGDSILQFFDFVDALVSGRVVQVQDLQQAALRKRVRATLGRWFAR